MKIEITEKCISQMIKKINVELQKNENQYSNELHQMILDISNSITELSAKKKDQFYNLSISFETSYKTDFIARYIIKSIIQENYINKSN